MIKTKTSNTLCLRDLSTSPNDRLIKDSMTFIKAVMEKNPGLYVHIPFCVSKCHYCSFYSVTSVCEDSGFLAGALQRDGNGSAGLGDRWIRSMWEEDLPRSSPGGDLEDLLRKRPRENFILLPDTEITVEVNPGDLDISFLRFLIRDRGKPSQYRDPVV